MKIAQKGFTLIEVVITIFVFTMIIYGTVALVGNLLTSSNTQSRLLADADQARKVAFTFASEVRNGQAGNDGSYSLNQAGDQQIIFFTGQNGSTIVNKIRYYLSSGTLYKGITAPSGPPYSYNPANEVVTAVQNNLANGSNPVFYYYDGNYTGVSGNPLSQPVNLTTVKYVKINLIITNKAGVSNTLTYPISSGAAIRNLKTNLGN